MRFYVQRVYSRHTRGSRVKGKYVGYTVHRSPKDYSPTEWHKKEFGHQWLIMMIWNHAALEYEGGIERHCTKRAYKRRFGI